ncbi:Cobalt ABC transporter, inner membrane subunit CbiQ [Rhodospirillaceae bacterium LM-1]|nr:Cobalt ABC transporter, inner membrane subunit CbiQ [Rhodospirillaceae bacterium LM-1]
MGAGCAANARDLGKLDRWARESSPVHALDPRAKLLAVLAFALAVVSLDKYALGEQLPFFAFPIFLWARSGVPAGLVAKRVLAVAPFAAMVGLFNPLFDTATLLTVGGVAISGGWISFVSILLRGLLTISALVLLVATTDIPKLSMAAERLGVPRIFVAQMQGLYRYLFLLADEAGRIYLAFRLRSPNAKPPSWRVYAAILGQLLLRSLERAGRVHQAMLLRGFNGEMRSVAKLEFDKRDWRFLILWLCAIAALRFLHPAPWIGDVLLKALS